jgi:predicted ATPase
VALISFTVGGFQSYREPQTVTIDPDLTLVAGRNNVGKSALLRALRVFVEPQEGWREDFDVSYTWSLTSEELLRLTLGPMDTSNEWTSWANGRATHLVKATYRMTPGSSDTTVGPSNLYLYGLELPDEGKRATGAPGGSPQWDTGEWAGDAFIGLLTRAPEALVRRVRFVAPRRIESGLRPLQPTPNLEPDARNLTEVALYLDMRSKTRTFRALTDFMVTAFPEIEALTVMPADEGTASGRLALNYEDLEQPISLEQSGTGVAQMLALATAILTTSEQSLFLIDEPQAYLHPHAERSLLKLLLDNPLHQYVIATHSGFLLSTYRLANARLLTVRDGATQVTEFPSRTDLLSELGITAADLWSTEKVLWVEGRSEVEAIAIAIGDAAADVVVRPMPESASRFSSTSTRQADATYRFLEDVATAIAPLPVRMLFLFDMDEKTPEHRARIETASGGAAVFLPTRELENLFLDADLLTRALQERAELVGVEPPTSDEVQAKLDDMLTRHEDRSLFLRTPPAGDDPRHLVRGAEVLRRLYWGTTQSAYDKVSDGKRLAELAKQHKPELLEPLRAIVRGLLGD